VNYTRRALLFYTDDFDAVTREPSSKVQMMANIKQSKADLQDFKKLLHGYGFLEEEIKICASPTLKALEKTYQDHIKSELKRA